MSEGEKLLIEAAAHNCEAALIRDDHEIARLASEFAFFVAVEAAKIPTGDRWSR